MMRRHQLLAGHGLELPQLIDVLRIERLHVAVGGGGRRRRHGDSHPAAQRGAQVLQKHRLAQIVVHAGGQTGLAVLAQGVGGHRDDPRALFGRPFVPDAPRRLEPVHSGHLDVHEDDVVALPAQRVQSLLPVGGHVRRIAQPLQQEKRHLLVDHVVLGDQDAQRRKPGPGDPARNFALSAFAALRGTCGSSASRPGSGS